MAEAGVCSRRKGEDLIVQGRVHVNGVLIRELGTKINPSNDSVLVDGKPVLVESKVLYIFHKPRGVVSTLDDEKGRSSVKKFVRGLNERVFPVGRLDMDVNGLLLLTNDGDFANSLLHPRYEIPRVYHAIVQGHLTKEVLSKFCKGVMLEDGPAKAKEAKILREGFQDLLGPLRSGESALELTVCQGRKHFVKNLLAEAGCPVRMLGRVSFGQFNLGKLGPGDLKRVDFPN